MRRADIYFSCNTYLIVSDGDCVVSYNLKSFLVQFLPILMYFLVKSTCLRVYSDQPYVHVVTITVSV